MVAQPRGLTSSVPGEPGRSRGSGGVGGGGGAARAPVLSERADRRLPGADRAARRRWPDVRRCPGHDQRVRARVPRARPAARPRGRRAARARARRGAGAVRDPAGGEGPVRDRRAAGDCLEPGARGQRRPARCDRVGAAERGRNGAARAHPHPRVRRRGHDRPGRQPARPDPGRRRLERRQRRGAGRADGTRGARQRHVRLAADPIRLLRNERDQADPGRLPLDGIIPLSGTLDHPGPMARTVADCAALLQGMAAPAHPSPRRAHRQRRSASSRPGRVPATGRLPA